MFFPVELKTNDVCRPIPPSFSVRKKKKKYRNPERTFQGDSLVYFRAPPPCLSMHHIVVEIVSNHPPFPTSLAPQCCRGRNCRWPAKTHTKRVALLLRRGTPLFPSRPEWHKHLLRVSVAGQDDSLSTGMEPD